MSEQAGDQSQVVPAGDDGPELDTEHAHPARVYNYWLGGDDNFAADREAAEQAIAANPGIVADVRANRAFLVRAVRCLAAERGVRQFLDIGTGLPTEEAHGKLQPTRVRYARSFSSGAREMQVNVTSRAFRWDTAPLNVSAAEEQTGQPAV